MKLAFCLFEYFPFGGMQRDCFRIAQACVEAGAEVEILTRQWQGEKPSNMVVHEIPTKGFSNAKKVKLFANQVQQKIKQEKYDGTIGFSKMPGLDVYYAADPCYIARVRPKYGPFYKLTNNYRTYTGFERDIFLEGKKPQILSISPIQKKIYQKFYNTEEERFHTLPPGIQCDRCAPVDYLHKRIETREKLSLDVDSKLVLFVGSGFKTKGLDRALNSIEQLPEEIKASTEFWIVGEDDPRPYQKQIKQLKIAGKVHFLGGRNDIPDLLLAADALIHPAYSENTGTVLLEAMVAGLPVIASEACGYANYIKDAQGGIVVPEPFSQQRLTQALEVVLDHPQPWRDNGIQFGLNADIYSLVDQAQQTIFEIIKGKAC